MRICQRHLYDHIKPLHIACLRYTTNQCCIPQTIITNHILAAVIGLKATQASTYKSTSKFPISMPTSHFNIQLLPTKHQTPTYPRINPQSPLSPRIPTITAHSIHNTFLELKKRYLRPATELITSLLIIGGLVYWHSPSKTPFHNKTPNNDKTNPMRKKNQTSIPV